MRIIFEDHKFDVGYELRRLCRSILQENSLLPIDKSIPNDERRNKNESMYTK